MSICVDRRSREGRALEDRVSASVARRCGEERPLTPRTTWVRTRVAAYSTLHVFRNSTNSHARPGAPGVVVKVFRGSADAAALARAQYDMLVALWPLFGSRPDVGVPQPIDFFPDVPAVVMEEVAGRPIHAFFGPAVWLPRGGQAPERACRAAGAWLRVFHDVTRIAPGPLDVDAKLGALPDIGERLRQAGCARSLVEAAEGFVRTAAARVVDRPLPRARVHGEFSVDNVLVAPGRTCGLDIHGRHLNAVYHDLASFLNSLDLVALTRPVPRRVGAACERAFLSGYFRGEPCDSDALRFLRGFGLACSALEVIERRSPQVLIGRLVRHSVSRALARFLAVGGPA